MGIKSSDVDCFARLPARLRLRPPGAPPVLAARGLLRRRPDVFANLFAITSAKVPIVKFLHVPTGTNCDLSFKSPSGVRNSKLICHLLHLDRRALDLAILVKYWSKVHNLTGTNLMPNYALTLLVIFYLQHLDVLPSVFELQKRAPSEFVDGWNTGFEEGERPNGNEWSLLQIVGGFFSYYGIYDFEHSIVSPYLGRSIARESFKRASDVPEEFQLYKENLGERCGPLKLDTPMCVQDPFDHSRNCAVAVFYKLSHKVCAQFKLAAALFEKESGATVLKALLRPPAPAPAPAPRRRLRKPRQPDPARRGIKKHLKQNLHALYTHINKLNREKR